MKISTVILILLAHSTSCQKTLVVQVPNHHSIEGKEKIILSLTKEINIAMTITFCIRFYLKGSKTDRVIFSNEDDKLELKLRFSAGLGTVDLNGKGIIFGIPIPNSIQPYSWHHICFNSNEKTFQVVVDGSLWYHGNQTIRRFEKTTLSQFLIGSAGNQDSIAEDPFKGEMSEFNIWSQALSVESMAKITENCGNLEPGPDLLKWSDVTSSMISGQTNEQEVKHLCSNSDKKKPMRKLLPYIENQVGSIHLCNILNGKLIYPKTSEEYQIWNSKYTMTYLKLQ